MKQIGNRFINQKVEDAFASIVKLTNQRFEQSEKEFNESKEKAAEALQINPRQALEYQVKHSVEKQTLWEQWSKISLIVQQVADLPMIDNFTKIFLIGERVEKFIKAKQRDLTNGFSFPSSSSQISNFLEAMIMQLKFQFYFDNMGVQLLTYEIEQSFRDIAKACQQEDEAMLLPDLAERVERETRYQEGELVEVVVSPNNNEVKINVTDSELSRTIFTFFVSKNECTMRLSEYAIESRQTTRHRNFDYKIIWQERSGSREKRAGLEIPSTIELFAKQAASMITGIKPETIE